PGGCYPRRRGNAERRNHTWPAVGRTGAGAACGRYTTGADAMSALAGRVVIVTRAEHQAAALESLLQAEGATVYRYPCLAIAPPDNLGPLDDALRAAVAGQFDWLALTSANAVDAVAQRLAALGMPSD